MFESLTEYVSGSPWTYVFLFGVSALDVIIPLVPSETSVILAGVLASTGDLVLVLVILFAAGGAIVGDNISYWIGRKVGHRIVDRFFKGERRKQVDWAHRQVEQRGGYLIIIGRFIPAGRTAVTLSCGMLEMPWRRFIAFDIAAGLVWATYAAMLGYVGGEHLRGGAAQRVPPRVRGRAARRRRRSRPYRWYRKRHVLAGS